MCFPFPLAAEASFLKAVVLEPIRSTRRCLEFGSAECSPSPRAQELPTTQRTPRIVPEKTQWQAGLQRQRGRCPERGGEIPAAAAGGQCLPGRSGPGEAGWQPARRAPPAAAGCGGRAATTITLPLSPSQVQHICKWCQLICWLADGELRLPFIAQRRLRLLSLALTFLLLEQMQRLPEFGCASTRTEALRQLSASLL